MSTKTMLNDEIQAQIEEVSKLQVGGDDYKIAVEGVSKLIDKMVELEKLETDKENKALDREFDQEFKLSQAKVEKHDRKIKNWLTAAGIVVPTGLTIWGTIKTLKFEEAGSITTTIGKSFIGKLFKK